GGDRHHIELPVAVHVLQMDHAAASEHGMFGTEGAVAVVELDEGGVDEVRLAIAVDVANGRELTRQRQVLDRTEVEGSGPQLDGHRARVVRLKEIHVAVTVQVDTDLINARDRGIHVEERLLKLAGERMRWNRDRQGRKEGTVRRGEPSTPRVRGVA